MYQFDLKLAFQTKSPPILVLLNCRDQFLPLYTNLLGHYCIYDAAWTVQPLGILMAMEDGSIRGVVLDAEYLKANVQPGTKVSSTFVWRGRSPSGAIWRIATHPLGHHIAYCGEDGVVGLANVEFYFDHRKRTSHLPLCALRSEGTSLRVVSGEELAAEKANGGLFQKGGSGRGTGAEHKKIILDSSQALHSLAWGPRSDRESGRGYWLSTGGASGVVCLQWVPVAQ
jgi:hypothetical protein